MCAYMCKCVYVCICMCVHVQSANSMEHYMYLCTEWTYFNSSLLIKESLQNEAIRSMVVKILTTNSSLVNGTSNTTQM